MNSVHIEDDPVDQYDFTEQLEEQDVEAEIVVEETPAEEASASLQNVVNIVQESPSVPVEEPVGEPEKKTWASIVCS